MARRRSIYIDAFRPSMPIPNGCRVGNIVMSGAIIGVDPATGKVAPTVEEQCRFMFAHMKAIVEGAGGSTTDIVKMNVIMPDRSQRAVINGEWLRMFPDETSRPARHTVSGPLDEPIKVQCDFMAVIG